MLFVASQIPSIIGWSLIAGKARPVALAAVMRKRQGPPVPFGRAMGRTAMEWHPIDAAAGIAGWAHGDGDMPVVVLHGGPGLTDYTEALADEVAAASPGRLRVIRYQQRG